MPLWRGNHLNEGVAVGRKYLLLDQNKKVDELDPTLLKIGGASVTATPAELNRGALQITDTLITTAQVLALFATPITVVAAPGAGKYSEFVAAQLFLDFNAAAYAGIAAGEDLVFKYTDASGVQVSQTIETTGFLDATADQLAIANPDGTDLAGVINAVDNAVIVLHLLVAEIITGDSPLKVRVFHRDIVKTELEAIA